jgi:Ca2+-binding RTX toxin-like protein
MAEFIGTEENELFEGGEDADTLTGGMGADTLSGGPGGDLFLVRGSDSPASHALTDTQPAIDVITDWSPDDRVVFVNAPAADETSLFAGVAADYAAAYDLSQTAFADGFEYASIKVGSDIFVFAPRSNGVVKLAGVDPDDVTSVSPTTDMSPGQEATFGIEDDDFEGGVGGDTVIGMEGADTLAGKGGDDRMFGGEDNDSMSGGEGRNYLRGDEGEDVLRGGAQHDDLNGNMGRDTIDAGAGDDWVRGGKDDDQLFAGAGHDLAFGDLGDDIVGGGDGDDQIFGGAGRDILRGDAGRDTLSGDAGNDTLDGGIGGDVFVLSAGGGVDRVLDFDADEIEGDVVRIAAGETYEGAQVDADTVITLSSGDQMILSGGTLATLPEGWIVQG